MKKSLWKSLDQLLIGSQFYIQIIRASVIDEEPAVGEVEEV